MAAAAQLVLNCVGPFRFFGEVVVKVGRPSRLRRLVHMAHPQESVVLWRSITETLNLQIEMRKDCPN
jgi:hypothetical protein